jgi:hypothetical protein
MSAAWLLRMKGYKDITDILRSEKLEEIGQ